MYFLKWTTLIILIFLSTSQSSDLLDEYVKHVGETNKLQTNTQRHKRSLEFNVNERIERDVKTNIPSIQKAFGNKRMLKKILQNEKTKRVPRDIKMAPYVPSVQKAFRNRQMLKKFLHTSKNEKKIKLNKRNKRSLRKNFESQPIENVSQAFQNRTKRSPLERKERSSMFWTHVQALDDKGDVILKWQPRHQEITFRIEARTRGYIAIGFSPSGGMKGADIVVGWVDDRTGQPYLLDMHASESRPNGPPVKDEVENYTLMLGAQNDTHTSLEFRRAFDTCDSEDFVLGGDTVRVIWAMNDMDPSPSGKLFFHDDRRGEQSLYLLGPPTVSYPAGIKHWDITLKNFVMPDNSNTFYWCKIFKAPTLVSKHHIVGYEPLLGERHKAHLHHMLVRECQLTMSELSTDMAEWDNYVRGDGTACYGQDMPERWGTCSTPFLAWAVGSKGEILPSHVGIPLAEMTHRYYMLEVHFDNPGLKRAQDTSGLRIHYTDKLRKHDAGILSAGVALTPLHVVPPRQPEYRSAGYCSTDCTKQMFPKDGITVVSVLLHSHLAGRKMNLRHIRAGKELAPIVQDNQYDFNYQHPRLLTQETRILPGDALLTECTYSTVGRDRPTIGGYSTANEMCLAFILHYPRTELAGCYSMPPVKFFFDTYGVREFYGKGEKELKHLFLESSSEQSLTPFIPSFPPGSETSPEVNRRVEQAIREAREYTVDGESHGPPGPLDTLVIKEPQEFRNKTFMSHLNEIPWEEELLTKRIEESFYAGEHLSFCRKRDDSLAYTEKIEMLPNFTAYVENRSKLQCSYRLQPSPSKSDKISPLKLVVCLTIVLLSR